LETMVERLLFGYQFLGESVFFEEGFRLLSLLASVTPHV
jgi:hypothetical protein